MVCESCFGSPRASVSVVPKRSETLGSAARGDSHHIRLTPVPPMVSAQTQSLRKTNVQDVFNNDASRSGNDFRLRTIVPADTSQGSVRLHGAGHEPIAG